MPKSTPGEGAAERPRCPACRVELRIRDDKTAAPVFPCPECQTPLRLDRSVAGRYTVLPADAPVRTKPVRHKTKASPPVPTHAEVHQPPRTWWWFGLGAVVLGSVFTLWLSSGQTSSTHPVADQPAADKDKPQPAVDVPRETPLADRLAEVSHRVETAAAEWGHFPSATAQPSSLPPPQQLSWLARLEARSATLPSERRPVLDVPWNDPANEPFVGRRIPTYLNPHVTTSVGDDGRPATHFAGVAGVGRDAVDLPMGHPRAGMFGTKRRVTVDDLRDGQAQALMVLGVDAQLGSWADPGRATVRALTQPPYLHGPDGFGGGNEQPLPALMADGSVRMFAADTDPRLLRRLAAIADGLPLNLNLPGEPGDTPPPGSVTAPSITTGVAIHDPENPAVSALVAIAEAQRPTIVRPPAAPLLQQRLVSFQQTKPTTRRQLLLIAEDLLGRPVVLDAEQLGTAAPQLDTKVSFSLDDTTIATVLEQVLNGSDLELVIGPDRAVVRRKAAEGTPSVRIEP